MAGDEDNQSPDTPPNQGHGHKPGDRALPDGSANRNPDGTLKELDPTYDQPGSGAGDRPPETTPQQAPGMGTLYPDDDKAGE